WDLSARRVVRRPHVELAQLARAAASGRAARRGRGVPAARRQSQLVPSSDFAGRPAERRMMPPSARREFETHWQSNAPGTELPAIKKQAAREFLSPLFEHLAEHPDAAILDAGCGDGVHLATIREAVVRQSGAWVALDISAAATAVAKIHGGGDWMLVQG